MVGDYYFCPSFSAQNSVNCFFSRTHLYVNIIRPTSNAFLQQFYPILLLPAENPSIFLFPTGEYYGQSFLRRYLAYAIFWNFLYAVKPYLGQISTVFIG